MEVNPSGVVSIVWRCLPGAAPGLLDVDTSGVRNKNILQPWEMDFQYNPWFSSNPMYCQVMIMVIKPTQLTIRDAFPIVPVLQVMIMSMSLTSLEGWTSNSPGFARGKGY